MGDKDNERCRHIGQMLIAEIGSAGPENAEQTVERAVKRLREHRDCVPRERVEALGGKWRAWQRDYEAKDDPKSAYDCRLVADALDSLTTAPPNEAPAEDEGSQ